MVAAYLVALAGRDVTRRDVDARDLGQRRRQQAGLQSTSDVGRAGLEPGVVDRKRGPAGEFLGEQEVVLGEAPPRARRDQRHRAEDATRAVSGTHIYEVNSSARTIS